MSIALERKIAAILTSDTVEIADVEQLIGETQQAYADACEAIKQAKARSLDPTIIDRAAFEQIREADYQRARYEAALPRLSSKLVELRNRDAAAAWNARYAALEKQSDKISSQFAEEYCSLTERLVDLLRTMAVVDGEIARLNADAPVGESRRLANCECQAMGIKQTSRNEPSIVAQLVLPDWQDSRRLLWPPARPSLADFVAPPLPHRGAEWWIDLELQKQERIKEQERVAAFYEEQTRLREQQEHAEQKARRA